MNLFKYLMLSFSINCGLSFAYSPPEHLPDPMALPNDAMLDIPIQYKSCIDLLVNVQKSGLLFEDAEDLVMREKDLIASLYLYEDEKIPVNYYYAIQYHQTFRLEYERLKALKITEAFSPDDENKFLKDPAHYVFGPYYSIDTSYASMARGGKNPFIRLLGCASEVTAALKEFGLSAANPLPDIYSLAIHKLFFMLYINIILVELEKMYDRDCYLDNKFWNGEDTIVMAKDCERPFMEVFDDIHRHKRVTNRFKCGSDIFHHFNAILPFVRYVGEDGKPVVVPPASGADGAAHS